MLQKCCLGAAEVLPRSCCLMGTDRVQWWPMVANGVPLRHTHVTPRPTPTLRLPMAPVASCGSIGPLVVLMNPDVVPKACVRTDPRGAPGQLLFLCVPAQIQNRVLLELH